MAEALHFLQDLAVITGIAAITSLIFQRLRFPLVFGLLVAGVLIGPFTPPFSFVRDESTIRTLADLGVVLLLFGLGLDFNLRGIRRVGTTAVVVTLIEVLFMFWLGLEAAILLGWSRIDGIFLGAMLSISSTAIIVVVLREAGRMNEESSRIVFAVLILEDLIAILMLVFISGFTATGALPVREAGLVLAKMGLFLLATLLLGLVAVPRFVDFVSTRFRHEVLVLSVLGLALAGAVLSAAVGFHVGLGAFIMGALVGEARQRSFVQERLRPVHDYFAAIFFVSIGTLVNFDVLAQYWKVVVILVALIVVGKLVSGGLSTFLLGHSPRTAFVVGASLAQIGEFSFVIAALGLATETMAPFLFPVIVGTAAVTSFASPFLIRHADAAAQALGRVAPAPLRTYAAVYATWTRRMARRRAQRPSRGLQHARQGTIVGALLLVLAVGGGIFLAPTGTGFLEEQGFFEPSSSLIYWGGILILVVPLVFEFRRHVRRWADEANRVATGNTGRGLGVRNVVQHSIVLMAILLGGLPVLVATAPLLHRPLLAVAWIAMVGSAGFLLWASIRRLHRRVHENVGTLLQEEDVEAPLPEVVKALLSEEFPLDLEATSVRLELNAWAVGKRLGDLGLRSATGATLVLIERSNGTQVLPGGEVTLLPEDRLTLVGSPEQLEAARALLTRPAREAERAVHLQPGRIYVAEASAMEGKTLSDAALRTRFGLQVVAIVRGDGALTNPDPGERLAAADILVVLGTQDQILAANREANTQAPPPPPGPARKAAPD